MPYVDLSEPNEENGVQQTENWAKVFDYMKNNSTAGKNLKNYGQLRNPHNAAALTGKGLPAGGATGGAAMGAAGGGAGGGW
jgi:hypothetical protein